MKKLFLNAEGISKNITLFFQINKPVKLYRYINYNPFKKHTCVFIVFFFLFDYSGLSQMVYTGNANSVYKTRINLTAGIRVRFETKNLSPGSDPIINLLSPEGFGVAANDNGGGGLAAQLNYFPIHTGSYFLVVRSRTMEKKGTADIYRDGVSIADSISFGGWQIALQNLRAGESLQTVKIPGGSNGIPMLFVMSADGISIQQIAATLGSDIALIKLPASIGNRTVIIGTHSQEGLVRLVRNDAGIPNHDLDKDGLGYELENELGTCAVKAGFAKGFDCSQIADARDTDGDGISDGWEVLGRFDMQPFQLLPKWGANPRHKDLFIEVDFMRRTGGENKDHFEGKMSPDVAKNFAAIYGDAFTLNPTLKLFHASILKNPDGISGISVHLDTGVEPLQGDDVTVYGNWGGYNGVDAVRQDGTLCTPETPDQNCRGVAADKNPQAWKDEAWKYNMNKVRYGIFRYALGYSGGGGQCGNTFACAFNFDNADNAAHEWGHTLGMGHSGPYNVTGAVDVNCKPNYKSIMNYAFLYRPRVGFSDGDGMPSLNNAFLKEWNAVSPSNTIYLDVLENEFNYWVDRTNGHVDWNRNGIFEPANEKVKAYANYIPRGSCEFTKYSQFHVGDAQTAATPVLARLKDRINNRERLYVFYPDHGSLKYRSMISTLNCPSPIAEGCDGASWGPEKDAGMAAVGVDVTNDGNSLRVVAVELFGKIMEKRLVLNLNLETWTQAVQIPGSARGEISLLFALTGSYLVYKGLDGFIHYNKLFAGQWQTDQIAHNSNNEPVKTNNTSSAYPSIIQTFLPWKPNAKGLYGLFPDENDKLDMWWYNSTGNYWEKTDVLENPRPGPIYGKPSMAYVPYTTLNENPGRLYMTYLNKPAAGVFYGVIKMRMSYVKVNTASNGTITKEEKVGLDSYFDNSWLSTFAISLFYQWKQDTNLRSVFSIKGSGVDDYKIMFRPKADGINDFEYKNYNDWETIRKNICKQVVNPGGLVVNPIKCSQ